MFLPIQTPSHERRSLAGPIAASATKPRACSPPLFRGLVRLAPWKPNCASIQTTSISGNKLRIRVFGPTAAPAANEFLLVSGTTQLTCAVDGAVEGTPCTLSGTAPTTPWATVTGLGSGRQSRLHAVEWVIDTPTTGPYLYLVHLRPGMTGGAGAYEDIAGIATPVPSSLAAGECTSIPYDPISHDGASKTTETDEQTAAPRSTCGGIEFNAPIPLEDEIIDNGDPYENSWKHHLDVAAAAAAYADTLGQNLIESGLNMDRRAETAIDTIQNTCGVAINVDELFNDDGSLGSLVQSGATCDESSDGSGCDASSGYECVGTICVKSTLFGGADSAQRRQIMECLGLNPTTGAPSIVARVGLGNTHLCAWYENNDPGLLCRDSSLHQPCPYPAPDTDVCASPPHTGTQTQILIDGQPATNSALLGLLSSDLQMEIQLVSRPVQSTIFARRSRTQLRACMGNATRSSTCAGDTVTGTLYSTT